jgi:DNA primase
VRALAVEGLPGDTEPDAERAASLAARLAESVVAQQISARKSRLQRMNPVTEKKQYDKLFSELIVLEARRRELRERSLGSQ